MVQEEKRNIPKYMLEAMIAVLIPVYGYFLAYTHEMGFCFNYKIPISLIEIDLNLVLLTITSLLIFVYIMNIIFQIIGLIRFNGSILARRIFTFIVINIFFIFFLFSFDFHLVLTICIIVLDLFYIVIEFILPIFLAKGEKGYKNKLEYQRKHDWKDNLGFFFFIKRLSFPTFMTVLIVTLLLFGAPTMGALRAKVKKSYMIIHSKPKLVVLQKYSKKYICAPFDRKKKEIKNEFYIKSLDQIEDEKFKLTKDDIGPLKIAKKEKAPKKNEKKELQKNKGKTNAQKD